MSRIMICGLNGSGKTTLGKELSKKINFLHKDIEEYYFNNDTDYKYNSSATKEEVTQKIEKDINKYDKIIFTSCTGDYGNLSDLYDFVIFIRLDKETRLKRVKKRSYKQFGDRILENGDLFEKENKFWDKVYKKDESDINEWFNNLKCSKLEIDGLRTVEENVNIILDKLKEIKQMEKRMNKEELIELIESLKLDKDEFWILSSGALVIRGIYPDAGDLDIAVTEKGLEELKKNYDLKEKGKGWYEINEKIECILDTKEPWKIEKVEGYNLQSIEKYYEFLKESNREKDKARIPLIKEYIKKEK